jgi:surface antigen
VTAQGNQALLLALIFASAAALAMPAMADPKPKPGKGVSALARGQKKHVHGDLYASKGGPPPWAPAHGYRRKNGNGAWVYVPPFGISTGTCDRKLLGGALGGAAGGLLASEVAEGSERLVAVTGGTVLGALIGGSIGRSMDQLDHRCVGQILEHAPSDEAVAWKNPDTESSYTVTAARTYQNGDDRYCREYQTTATVGGKSQQAYGTACRQPDGSWQIVD